MSMADTRLGRSGLRISRLVLGCMGFGDPSTGRPPWAIGPEGSRAVIHAALYAGITTFDTANGYSLGASEEILGRVLRDAGVRDETVIATKVFARMGPGPAGGGLSRTAILHQADASLRRLGTDHIDLYQLHRFDPDVPVEETVHALDDLVRTGKVRYVGASSMAAWQFAKLQHAADLHGWTRFVSMQGQYNLLRREEEREMLPMCLDDGVGVIPWSPLAGGRLARPWGATTARSASDAANPALEAGDDETERRIVDSVGEVAARHGASPAHVSLAWLLSKPAVSAPIVGATAPEQVRDTAAALEVALTDDDVAALERNYLPRHPTY